MNMYTQYVIWVGFVEIIKMYIFDQIIQPGKQCFMDFANFAVESLQNNGHVGQKNHISNSTFVSIQ